MLSLFVFYIHFRVFSVFKNANGLTGYLFDMLLVLTKVAVPLFFVISGALFYRDYTWKLTTKKWKSRLFSLCVPYLIWNTIWLCLALLGHYTPLGIFLGGVKTSFSIRNIFNGIFLYGNFEPFWFIYQLIILTVFCPLIYLLLKNKWIGLGWIIVFYVASCFGFKLSKTLFPNSNMVILYLIGAWIGLHHFSDFTARRSRIQAISGLIIYILCCIFHWTAEALPEWCTSFQVPLLVTIISCGAFWIAFDYFDMQKCPKYMTYSFLIYALHSFIGATISKLLTLLIPSTQGYLLPIAVIAFPATVVVICIVGSLLDNYFPLLKRILTGR